MNDAAITRLARSLGIATRGRGVMIATAESCTGGGVGEAITRIAGSSEWFDRGFVTYSNDAKVDLLRVSPSTLDEFGAVSEEVAAEMARGALARSAAHASVAITGVAGPGGGTQTKPVGLVCFAWASRNDPVQCRSLHIKGDRARIRQLAVAVALQGLIDLLGVV